MTVQLHVFCRAETRLASRIAAQLNSVRLEPKLQFKRLFMRSSVEAVSDLQANMTVQLQFRQIGTQLVVQMLVHQQFRRIGTQLAIERLLQL